MEKFKSAFGVKCCLYVYSEWVLLIDFLKTGAYLKLMLTTHSDGFTTHTLFFIKTYIKNINGVIHMELNIFNPNTQV